MSLLTPQAFRQTCCPRRRKRGQKSAEAGQETSGIATIRGRGGAGPSRRDRCETRQVIAERRRPGRVPHGRSGAPSRAGAVI